MPVKTRGTIHHAIRRHRGMLRWWPVRSVRQRRRAAFSFTLLSWITNTTVILSIESSTAHIMPVMETHFMRWSWQTWRQEYTIFLLNFNGGPGGFILLASGFVYQSALLSIWCCRPLMDRLTLFFSNANGGSVHFDRYFWMCRVLLHSRRATIIWSFS